MPAVKSKSLVQRLTLLKNPNLWLLVFVVCQMVIPNLLSTVPTAVVRSIGDLSLILTFYLSFTVSFTFNRLIIIATGLMFIFLLNHEFMYTYSIDWLWPVLGIFFLALYHLSRWDEV